MNNILNYIQKNMLKDKNYIIGIDGGTGAGKTTLAKKLEYELLESGIKVITLQIDDFIHKRDIRYDDSTEEWFCFYSLQWRYDYLTNEILTLAKNNHDIIKDIEVYDKHLDYYKLLSIECKSPYIVISEGMFLQREKLRNFFDYIIYVDMPRKQRFERVLKRDTYIGNEEEIRKKYESRYFPAEDYYIKKYNPISTADFIYK